jgi:hypothetical protein
MKKLILLSALFIGFLTPLSAQIKQDRNVGSFTKLKVGSAIKVIITVGTQNKVVIEAEEKVIDKIKAEVNGNELHLFSKEHYSSMKTVIAYITVTELTSIHASGASAVSATSPINTKVLDIEASGASEIKLDIKTERLKLELSGASSTTFKGSTTNLEASVSGASALKAQDLTSAKTEVSASGASSAKVNASEVLKADASGASSIRYSGDPKNKSVDVSGSGSVKKS